MGAVRDRMAPEVCARRARRAFVLATRAAHRRTPTAASYAQSATVTLRRSPRSACMVGTAMAAPGAVNGARVRGRRHQAEGLGRPAVGRSALRARAATGNEPLSPRCRTPFLPYPTDLSFVFSLSYRHGQQGPPPKDEATGKVMCDKCGRLFDTMGGLGSHRRHCIGK